MVTKQLGNRKHIIDFSKVETWIEVSECIEYVHPTMGIDVLCSLLEWVHQNATRLDFYKMDKKVFYNILEKLNKNRDNIHELDGYVQEASNKLKEDKGLNVNDASKVGIPQKVLSITLEELVVFYNALDILEEEYDTIRDSKFLLWNTASYYKNINSIKSMLERRLMHGIVNRV